jgi:hypothetical protein
MKERGGPSVQYERMLDKAIQPSEDDMLKTVGSRVPLWEKIHRYINENYDFEPELAFFTKKYGWTVRYKNNVATVFDTTEQLHDGRWIWIRILDQSDLESFVVLLNAKRRPQKGERYGLLY